MTIILVIMAVTLIYIAFQLNEQLKFDQKNRNANKQKSSTTTNPLFSEEEIRHYKERQEHYQELSNKAWDRMIELETQEIKAHHETQRNKINFKPSEKLQNTMAEAIIAVLNRNNFRSYWRKMVESNISVINGLSIEDAEKKFYDNKELKMIGIMDFEYKHDEKIKAEYQKFAKDRAEYWANSWEHILNKS